MAIMKVNAEASIAKRRSFMDFARANYNADTVEITISEKNSKMGYVPSFSVMPGITCKHCSKCSEYCYAMKGFYNYDSNILKLANNTVAVEKDPENVVKFINKFLANPVIIYRFFRFNTAGDINENYLDNVILPVVAENPITVFYLYTKNYELINEKIQNGWKVPKNLVIIFSQWGNEEIKNPYNLPVFKTILDAEEPQPENETICINDCMNCLKCHKAKNGEKIGCYLH